MKFIYAPEGVEPREWPFDTGQMSSLDAIEIETRTKMLFEVWRQETLRGSVLARKALLFVLLRKDMPTLQWDQLEFKVSDIALVFDTDELAVRLAYLEEKAAVGPLSDADAEALVGLRLVVPKAKPDGDEPEDDASDPTQPPSEPEQPKRKQRDRSGND